MNPSDPQYISEPGRCSHVDAAGRRCRMPLKPPHPALCGEHALQERQRAEAARLTRELTSPDCPVKSAADVNQVLAKLFSAVSDRRIDLRQGALLAYIAQLMLQTLKPPDQPSAR